MYIYVERFIIGLIRVIIRVSMESGNRLYRGYIGILFHYSLLTTSKLIHPSFMLAHNPSVSPDLLNGCMLGRSLDPRATIPQ